MSDPESAESIAPDLLAVKEEREALEKVYNDLRDRFLRALERESRVSAGGLRLQAVRRMYFHGPVVKFLVDRGLLAALRPVPEVLDQMYQEGRLGVADIQPYVKEIRVSYQVVRERPSEPPGPSQQATPNKVEDEVPTGGL